MVLLIVCSENHSICCRESVRACVYLVGCWQARKHNPVWSIHFESGLEIQADRYIDVQLYRGGGLKPYLCAFARCAKLNVARY
jgi:hypothetical protein